MMQRSSRLAAALLLGTAPFLTGTGAAQEVTVPPAPEYQAPIVQRIIVQGNQRIEAETVRSYLPVRPGQAVDQLTIDTALKALFGTGLFADAQIVFDQLSGTLQVAVQENPIVNRVIYEGNRRTKEDKLAEEVQLAPRAVYTEAKVQSDVQRILQVYRASGRFGATVTPKIVELPQNRVDVIFEIEEGPTTGVAKINFIGNEAFTDAELRAAILTAESRWYDILESNDNYDPDRLEYDRQLLREFYTTRGYADFSVTSAVAELTPDREDFFITITVEEGPQFEFGRVDVRTTLAKIPGEQLERSIPVRSGEPFNSELIERSEEAITYATGIAGYAFVGVNPQLSVNRETQTVDVTFEVNEGPRVYVERIDIGGNTQTLDRVIRREMWLAEGDAFNRVLVDRSERRIRGLGYFSDVAIEELPGSAPDRTVLDVNVTEQPTGSFQIGGGLSSADNFIINAQVEQRNLLGKGQYILLDLSASARTRRAQVRFTEPRFLGRNLLAGFTAFANRTDFEEAGFVSDSLGAGVNVGFPVSNFGRLNLNYQLRNDDIQIERRTGFTLEPGQDPLEVLVPGVTADDFDFDQGTRQVIADVCDFQRTRLDPSCENRGEFLTSQIGYSVGFNTVNDPINPSNGYFMNFGQTFAGLGGDVQYLRSVARGSIFKPLPYDLVGVLRMDLGYIEGFGDNTVRLNDRFFVGGNRGFRGFDVAGVGPRYFQQSGQGGQVFDRAIGAKAQAIGTAELAFPVPLPEQYGIRAALFTDFGAVGGIDDADKVLNDDRSAYFDIDGDGEPDAPIQDDFAFRMTAGVSINWNSPFGPVQIDLSQAVVREEYDDVQTFRFNAGRQF
jgi:outer membrane protein insertion porin family